MSYDDRYDGLTDDNLHRLSGLLIDPASWAEPSEGVEDAVQAAIASAVAAAADGAAPAVTPGLEAAEPRAEAAPPTQGGQPPAVPPIVADAAPTVSPPAEVPTVAAPTVVPSSPPIVPPAGPPPSPSAATTVPANREQPSGPEQQPTREQGATVTPIGGRREVGRWLIPLAAAAVGAIVALGALSVLNRGDADDGVTTVALAGTESEPGASATARVEERPNGARISAEFAELPPAPAGQFYAFWVIRPEPRARVGAGTFHLRDGGGEIELWAGVSIETYNVFSVTLEREDAELTGPVVLLGTLDG